VRRFVASEQRFGPLPILRERPAFLVRERTMVRIDDPWITILEKRFWHRRVLKQYCFQNRSAGGSAAGGLEVSSHDP
jgi:hypothetical protein